MAKIPDGIFKNWQDTETVHASDYVQEREMLRAAANDNYDRISSLETSTLGLQLGTAQLQKITNDEGGVKISVISTSGDILSEIVAAGVGLHTFYAISGSKNLPPSNKSIRGLALITGVNPTYGLVWATDYENNFFHNYIDNGKWAGWDGPTVEHVLWEGAFFMTDTQTVKPTKPLSECRNGWQLVWSDSDTGPTTINDFDFSASTFIPKYMGRKYPGKSSIHVIPSYLSTTAQDTVNKKLKVTNVDITGFADNNNATTGTNDVVLRAVIEY